VVVALLLVGSIVFGGLDQYVGSVPTLPWGVSVSLLSAPWLLVAFIAGWTGRRCRAALLAGLAATYAALLGYLLMTLSPVEGAHLTVGTALAFCRSEAPVLVGGLVTGPLFGWFGYRWRVDRSWLGAVATALAFCLEPAADAVARPDAIPSAAERWLEIVAGLVMAGYVVAAARRPAQPT
jgi:hypothetical protein